MSRRTRQKQEHEKQKLAEKQIRHSNRKWKYGTIFVLVYLASLTPYATDLWRQPNLWNGIVFLLLSIGGCAAFIFVIKHERP